VGGFGETLEKDGSARFGDSQTGSSELLEGTEGRAVGKEKREPSTLRTSGDSLIKSKRSFDMTAKHFLGLFILIASGIGYSSWAVLYAWTNNRIAKLQLQD